MSANHSSEACDGKIQPRKRVFRRWWHTLAVVGLCAAPLALTMGAPARAQAVPHQLLQQQNQIQQLQQQQFDQMQRQRWQTEQPPAAGGEAPPTAHPVNPGTVCFTLRQVTFAGASLLSDADRAGLAAPYLGRCVTIDDINALIRAVTDLYGSRGYVTTRAVLPQQNVSGGHLILQVIEGRIQGFRWNGKAANDKSEVLAAFPHTPDADGANPPPLNLRDLEQGIDQINRLRANNAQMQLIPGDHPGETIIALSNTPAKSWRVTAGFDNSGQTLTGQAQAKGTAEIEDALGLDDDFEIDHSQSFLDNSSERASRSWTATGSVPYGDWRLNLSANVMEYRSLVMGQNQIYAGDGSQRALTLGVDRLLHRDGDSKTYASLSTGYESVQNNIAGMLINSSSPKLATVQGGLDDVRRVAGGVLHDSAKIIGGLHVWGARNDPSWPNLPKAQFTKEEADLSYAHPLSLAGLAFDWSTTAHGQWTHDSLYAPEQISIGSASTVTGYRDQVLLGNRGGYVRNELSLALPTGAAALDRALGALHPFAGYDIGTITHFQPDSATPGRLSGADIGLRLGGERLEGELTYAWALAHPALISPPSHLLTFSLVVIL